MSQYTNWANPRSSITNYFTVHEATYLPSWGIYHIPSDAEKVQLERTCAILEKIRKYFGDNNLNVHCMIRPNSVNAPNTIHHGQDYNAAIGSTAKRSPHIFGQACDFSITKWSCDDIRISLLSVLDDWGICMEDIRGAQWVHIDTYTPGIHGGMRYFKP